MEIAFLVLLIVPLTAASPLKRTQRSAVDIVLSEAAVQTVSGGRSEVRQEEHAPLVKMVPYHSNDKQLQLDPLKHSMAAKLHLYRRAPQRGCQFGTCQLQNLASTLYNIRKTSGKEASKNANDPQGFGR